MAFASPIWGFLADRFGRKAMYARSVAAGAAVLSVQSIVTSVPQLVAVRIANGVFTGSQTAAAMLLAGIVPRERTGYALGLMNAAVQVGNLVGPVLGGIVVVAVGLRTSFLIGAALLVVCAVATILYVQDAPPPSRALPVGVRGNLRDVFVPFRWHRLRGVLVVGGALHVLSSGSAGVMAIYIQDLAKPAWLTTEVAVGLAFAIGALAAAVSLPMLGRYADAHDPRRLLVISLAVGAASLVPQTLVPSAVVLVLCRIPLGVGLAGATSAIAVLTRMGARPGAEGRAFGALAAVQNLGWGTGPIAGAAFAAAAGIPALYLAAGALLLVTAVGVARSPEWFGRRDVAPDVQALPAMGAEPAD